MRVFCKCSAKIESKKFVSGVTILLSLTVFLNLVAETLPQVSDAIPLLGSKSYHYSSFCFELISYIFFCSKELSAFCERFSFHSRCFAGCRCFSFYLSLSLSFSVFYFWFALFSLCLLHILAAAPSGVAGAQDAFFITVFEAFIQLFVKMFVWMRGDVWARSGWRGAFTYFEYRLYTFCLLFCFYQHI